MATPLRPSAILLEQVGGAPLASWHVACIVALNMDAKESAALHPSVAQTLEKTIHDGLELARAELALAKRELGEQARAAAHSALFLLAGLMFLQAAVSSLGVLLILILGATPLGFVVVGGLVIVAAALGLVGIRAAKQNKFDSAERIKLDMREIAEAVK